MQKIKLNNKVTVVVNYKNGKPYPLPIRSEEDAAKIEKRIISLEEFTVSNIFDIPLLKIVCANLIETVSPVILWAGDDYDQIGQWTDEQAINKLSELLNSFSSEKMEKLFQVYDRASVYFGSNDNFQSFQRKLDPSGRVSYHSLLPQPNMFPILPI